MFNSELEGLSQYDQARIRSLLEAAVREMVHGLEAPSTSEQIFLKCANIRAVLKLAGAIRRNTSQG
jgi:hypothetical protein